MMTTTNQIRAGLAVLCTAIALAVPTSAGTSFRLEIGPPVAAGDGANKFKGAVLVVRPMLCDDPASVVITGTAEGVVNGARQSIPLRITSLATPGVHVVPHQWPQQGTWVLHLAGTCPAPKAQASTIVPLNRMTFIREKTQVLREPATKAQVEAVLSELVKAQS
jgi:hypothetical protein